MTDTRAVINEITLTVHQMAGRAYRIGWEALDAASQREVLRMLRDIEAERRADINQARLMPWRRS